MTNKEAIMWLSNETSAQTITEYKKKYGEKASLEKVYEAVDVAVEALRIVDRFKRIK